MKSTNFTKLVLSAMVILFTGFMAIGQGVTNSSINGQITDDKGESLIGANVLAIHGPTGSAYGNSTNLDGYFRLSNMKPGGPYKITISYTGYEDIVKDNVYLQLGQDFKIYTKMNEAATNLDEVVIVALRNDVFDGNRTGAETIIDEAAITNMPTVSRAVGDLARLTPQATIREGNDGFSISLNGVNNRYNAIYVDGAVNNDVFGLAGSGTNGGQTGVSPFSLDAIEEFQISLAPFDVRQGGFAGGSINAITRSGTNNFEGSVYGFTRNENLIRNTLEGAEINEFNATTTGFRLGGPIVKNKLFFFVNAELQRENIPLPFDVTDYEGDSNTADLSALENKLSSEYGFDAGSYTDNETFLDSDKITAKLDWNANNNNKLSFRYSYVSAENVEGRQSGPRNINYTQGSEYFVSKTNTAALEWNAIIGSNMANNLVLAYTGVRDDRDPFNAEFPSVTIQDGRGDIRFGAEPFSTANLLDQDIFTVTNNFEIYKGKHTFMIGTHNEFYSVANLFLAFNYGDYRFSSMEDFMTDQTANRFQRAYSLVDNVTGDDSQAIAAFGGGQFGIYVQDEFQASDNLKLTIGIRADSPFFDDTPTNDEFNNTTIPLLEAAGQDLQGAKTGQFIKSQLLFSPRIGFNLDVTGNNKTQLRGGLGIFTSRVPLVWPGGAYNNYGLNAGFAFSTSANFNPDINRQLPGEVDLNNVSPNGAIDLFAEDFKVPQVFKANIALDQKLGWGLIGNVDLIFNKTLNNVAYQNLNLKNSTETLTGTGDNRNYYDRRDEIDPTYGRIVLGYNTNEGYTYNFTASVTKPLDNGFSGMLAYSFGESYAVFDGTSSQNSSQWRGLHSVNGRNIDQALTRSDFAQGHRFISALTYGFNWGASDAKVAPKTTFTLFYEGVSGQPFTYIYNDNGSLNNEDSRERSLVYVPADQNDIILTDYTNTDGDVVSAAAQWSDLNSFIESNEYLSSKRGEYVERNAERGPFVGVIDLKVLQDFTLNLGEKAHTFQVSFDIFNFTNLLNESWGRRSFIPSSFELLSFNGFEEDANGNSTLNPTYSFLGVTDNDPSANRFDDSGVQSSRWTMQIGLRYLFK